MQQHPFMIKCFDHARDSFGWDWGCWGQPLVVIDRHCNHRFALDMPSHVEKHAEEKFDILAFTVDLFFSDLFLMPNLSIFSCPSSSCRVTCCLPPPPSRSASLYPYPPSSLPTCQAIHLSSFFFCNFNLNAEVIAKVTSGTSGMR